MPAAGEDEAFEDSAVAQQRVGTAGGAGAALLADAGMVDRFQEGVALVAGAGEGRGPGCGGRVGHRPRLPSLRHVRTHTRVTQDAREIARRLPILG